MASARPNSLRARRSISRASVTASAAWADSGSVTMPICPILRNSFMSAVLLPPQRAQHRLALREAMAEEVARHAQQLGDQTAAQRVIRERAVLARGHEMAAAQRGEMLGDGGLIQLERVLQLLHRPLLRGQQLEDADARRMPEGPEEIGLERLQLRRRHYIKIFEYIEDRVKVRLRLRYGESGH